MEYTISKILTLVAVVIVISIIWMFIVGFLWEFTGNTNYSQMAMFWLIGTGVLGYLYLRHAEK